MSALQHSFGGRSLDRYIYELEAVPDAPAAPDAPAEPVAPDGGGEPAPVADGRADLPAGGEPPAPAAPSFESLLATDEGRQAADEWFAERVQHLEREQQNQQQQLEGRQTADERETRISEALQLVGLEADEFIDWQRERLGLEPLQTAAQRQEQQEMLAWVDGELDRLGQGDHADLLGAGVNGLSELVDQEGQPVFKPDEIQTLSNANREQVLAAAAALQHQARAGGQELEPSRALADAARTIADRDTLIGRAAVEKFKKELAGVAAAPRTPVGSGAAAEGVPVTGDELAFVRQRLQTAQ